jgi:hypothetical protein
VTARSVAVTLFLAVASSACGDAAATKGPSVAGDESRPCVTAPLRAVTTEAESLPKGLSLLPGAQLVDATTKGATTTLTVEAPGTVSDAYGSYTAQLSAAGYPITKTDNEGREAELFYKAPGAPSSVIQMSTPACPPNAVRIAFVATRSP